MGKVISISNQKGGVGKTTTSINLSSYLAISGKRILLIDIDPQGNAGSGLGIDINKVNKTSYEMLIGEISASEAIQPTSVKNLSIISANIDLSGAEADLLSAHEREYRLKNAIADIRSDFDYIFLDCPPSLGILTVNALCAADSVMITLQTEYFALEGLSQLMNIIFKVQQSLNSSLELEGVVLTMFDKRTNLSNQVADDVRKYFQDKVFDTIIPRNIKLTEAPSFGKPINVYDPEGIGSKCYQNLAMEFLSR